FGGGGARLGAATGGGVGVVVLHAEREPCVTGEHPRIGAEVDPHADAGHGPAAAPAALDGARGAAAVARPGIAVVAGLADIDHTVGADRVRIASRAPRARHATPDLRAVVSHAGVA